MSPRHRGFSLVELLVVIGVVVLLLAILLPVIDHVRKSGRRAVCVSNLSQVGKSIFAYANDNHGEIPAVYENEKSDARPILWTRAVVEERGQGCGGIRLLVAPRFGIARQAYLRDAQILICPGQRATFPIPQTRTDDFLHAPHNDSGMSYAYFYVPSPTDARTPPSLKGTLSKFERHAVSQSRAGAIAIMSELTATNRKGRKNPDWHGPGGNVLFLDGHVVWIASADLPQEDQYSSETWMSDIDHAGTMQ